MSLQARNDSSHIAAATIPDAEVLDVAMESPANTTGLPLELPTTVANPTTSSTTSASDGATVANSTTVVAEDARTAVTRQKVIDIIDHQFDLEVLLRHAEGAAIAQELAKTERMLEDLRHAILSERQGAPYGNSTVSRSAGSQNAPQSQHYSSRQSSRRTTAYYGRDQRQPEALYAVRADGQFVRLGCPRCDRYDFGSIQGLINHMRLSHKLVFKNTEEGVRYCGIVVPSSEVPPDHPCRTKIVFSSLSASESGQGHFDLPKPTIKTYDEEVDLELDDNRGRSSNGGPASSQQPAPRKNSAASINSSSNAGSESESDTSGVVSGGDSGGLGAGKRRRRSSLALSIARPQKGKPGSKPNADSDSDGGTDESGSEATPRPTTAGKGPKRMYGSMSQGPAIANGAAAAQTTRFPAMDASRGSSNLATSYSAQDSRMSSAASSRAASPAIHPFMSENDISEPSTPLASVFSSPQSNILIPPSSMVGANNAAASAMSATTPGVEPLQGSGVVQRQHAQSGPLQHLQPTIISFGANAVHGGVPAPLDTVGSRFYVKRRMVVGNVSKYLPEDKRDPRLKEFPYKWMIYVDGTPKPEDITAYISKVEFHLHESYKPNHIVTVSEPPFHLSRYAWGETQIKVRLFFHDARNKPVEVYHRLALDPTHCGRQVHGRERHVDLELDRNTTFIPITPFQSRSSKAGSSASNRRPHNNLILNSAAEVAMADGAEEDERELQDTLSIPNAAKVIQATHQETNGGSTAMQGADGSPVDTVRAASVIEESSAVSKQQRMVKETTLSYCKACGSLWKQHRDARLGQVTSTSLLKKPVLLNEETGERIANCPHHPTFQAAKDVSEDEQMLLSLLVGRTKNKFALDMLKGCGIVDQNGRPISSHERMLREMQQQQQQLEAVMDLDIGDSELPTTPTSLLPLASSLSIHSMENTPLQQQQQLQQEQEQEQIQQQARQVEQLTNAFQRMEVYKCRRSEIDWVLSIMDELKLKTLSTLDGGAPAPSPGEPLQHQSSTIDADDPEGVERVPDSMAQRAVVGGLLVQATKAFLGSMLSKAIKIHRAETEAEKGPEAIMMELDELQEPSTLSSTNVDKNGGGAKVLDKLLTPHHIYQALQSNPEELDFLTSQYEDMEGIGEMMVGI
ncbi:YEATS domain-containing protein 2 [Mortierella alpina]|nr:YEATS domain-containing protein 2 [Mortierella alpina]